MFNKVLVANRGEIACRVLRTLRRLGIRSVAVYSEADANALHVREADEAVLIGPAPVGESYLRGERIIAAARDAGVEAIHPGYGFLSENAGFASACADAGIRFIGPTPDQIRRFGLKHLAREVAVDQGVPLLPGTDLVADLETARREAARIGYPVMCKSTAGGGGIGLRVCHGEADLDDAFESVRRLSRQNFGDAGCFLERYLTAARHIEVQIFGDGKGGVLALGERDCSTQRRNQKVIEEAPAPGLRPEVRAALQQAAVRMGQAVRYASAGTVEFVMDAGTQEIFFLEVNTRLQVEHGVTELVTGIDLVEWMIRQAAAVDDPTSWQLPAAAPATTGAAIEVRVYAEDPAKGFQPSTGRLTEVKLPPPSAARADGWIESGLEVTPHYDPLLVKLVTHGPDRAAAVAGLRRALAVTEIHGIETNLAYLRALLAHPPFVAGAVTTRMLEGFSYQAATVQVIDAGTQTTVQDWPGRVGLWAVGVPPSGPMDDLAFRVANRLVGNPPGAPALEVTLTGPTLRFDREAVVALAGAAFPAELDGKPAPVGAPFTIPAGGLLRLGVAPARGARVYLAVRGGLDVPATFGSRATFMLGGFGGHGGRALRASDVLRLGGVDPVSAPITPAAALTPYPETWGIAVLYGPHGAPDFFTPADIQTFFATDWRVHYNSDRTGVRLIGPRPTWARSDGGEAGLHPSNIHDNAYAVGTVDFTGDMPIILGPDGPSLGGFVCPATIVQAERWKMGQLKAGDRVRFLRETEAGAADRLRAQDAFIESLAAPPATVPGPVPALADDSPILAELPAQPGQVPVVYRRDGDDYLLAEYGPPTLDLGLRLRAHAAMEALAARAVPGVIDLTPGIRSLQVHYDPRALPTRKLLTILRSVEAQLPPIDDLVVPSRIVHLPLSWEDEATLVAIEKYMRVVRADAPWCPSNIEFIRRINGLDSVDDVRRTVFDASWLVLGLGDVYLGAPVATPVDPRHRLVTTKYNPARTWTPENAVGIGGAYLCIYGMEGPGGYQFVGRTVQVWNTHRQPPPFRDGKPWLLRFFDQIRFYPVDGKELLRMRAGFLHGRVPIRIEEGTFSFGDYQRLLRDNATDIAAFKRRQQASFVAERDRWTAAGQDLVAAAPVEAEAPPAAAPALPAGCLPVTSPVAGNLWRVLRAPGDAVGAGEPVAIVEAMKTEISVAAPAAGVVRELRAAAGAAVMPGQIIAVVDTAAP
jgi:urea carboxylase